MGDDAIWEIYIFMNRAEAGRGRGRSSGLAGREERERHVSYEQDDEEVKIGLELLSNFVLRQPLAV